MSILAELAPILAVVAALIGGALGLRRAGRKAAERDQMERSHEQMDKGREAVRDGRERGAPADRLRDNADRW